MRRGRPWADSLRQDSGCEQHSEAGAAEWWGQEECWGFWSERLGVDSLRRGNTHPGWSSYEGSVLPHTHHPTHQDMYKTVSSRLITRSSVVPKGPRDQ